MFRIKGSNKRLRRRGSVVVLTAVSATTLISFAALAVDVGLLFHTKTELQRTADAAALAGAWALILDDNRRDGDVGCAISVDNSRPFVSSVVTRNSVLNDALAIDLNAGNAIDGDIVFGMMSAPKVQTTVLVPCADSTTNACRVVVRRDTTRNGQVPLIFARIFGKNGTDVSATATAAFQYGAGGFRVTPGSGNADIAPFALYIDDWEQLIDGTHPDMTDNYTYDPDTGTVSPGSDGIPELNIYPDADLPAGNYGTVDVGSPDNSTADIVRQILYGVNADDLSYFGGELSFADGETIIMEGDTGISAGFKDAIAAIIGQSRAIPLFNAVSGLGNGVEFTMVRFGGVRIMDVDFTGALSSKKLIIQPAVVACSAVIPLDDPGVGIGEYVYSAPILVR